MTDSTITIGNLRPSLSRLIRVASWALLLLSVGSVSLGCARAPYVWAGDIPVERAKPDSSQNDIQPGDTILMTVVAQPELSAQHIVGSDGTIAVPNVGSVGVAGLTVKKAEAALTQRLQGILETPKVSVDVLVRRIEVTILGEVRQPGKFTMKSGDGVASALALAGGVTEFGNENAVFLVRSSEPLRIRFRLKDLVRGGESARAFALRDGDLLVIE